MLSRFFIYRPVFAGVISIVIVLAGLITVSLLPIEKTPDITPPTVKVSATYPGASAATTGQRCRGHDLYVLEEFRRRQDGVDRHL